MLEFLRSLVSLWPQQIVDDWRGILAAVLLAASLAVAQWVWRRAQGAIEARHSFTLSGYWIGECDLPGYKEPKLEIWRYVQRGAQVWLKFTDYDPLSARTCQWSGRGICRADMCSFYYYKHDKETYESGVLLLRVQGKSLVGIYGQFDLNADTPALFVSNFQPSNEGTTKYYRQRRAKLPWLPRVRMTLGLRPYDAHADVRALFDQHS